MYAIRSYYVNDSLKAFWEELFGSGGSFARMITVRCNDESIMAPALSRVVANYPQVYIKSLARPLGEVPELDILFTATSPEAKDREQFLLL